MLLQDILNGRTPFGLPLVGRDLASGRFTKLGDQVKLLFRSAAAEGINDFTNRVAELSLREVPKEDGDLAASAIYPGDDPDGTHSAHAEDLDASVSYNTPYAAAQHEGNMVYEREGREIVWIVKEHTTPGTKTKYLEDPLKTMVPSMEVYVAAKVREVFG